MDDVMPPPLLEPPPQPLDKFVVSLALCRTKPLAKPSLVAHYWDRRRGRRRVPSRTAASGVPAGALSRARHLNRLI
jgi:hypothetical protein